MYFFGKCNYGLVALPGVPSINLSMYLSYINIHARCTFVFHFITYGRKAWLHRCLLYLMVNEPSSLCILFYSSVTALRFRPAWSFASAFHAKISVYIHHTFPVKPTWTVVAQYQRTLQHMTIHVSCCFHVLIIFVSHHARVCVCVRVCTGGGGGFDKPVVSLGLNLEQRFCSVFYINSVWRVGLGAVLEVGFCK